MNINRLIKKCKKNDRKAQFRLYELFVGEVTNICERYCKDLPDAKDHAQKAFIKVFQNIERFDAEKGSFGGWVKRIAINECLQTIRRKDQLILVEEFGTEFNELEEEVFSQEVSPKEIRRLVDQLPDGYRTVFLLYVVEEYSHKEIAEQLGITEASSRSQFFKARQVLRKKVNPIVKKVS